jgi:hypothetical protein
MLIAFKFQLKNYKKTVAKTRNEIDNVQQSRDSSVLFQKCKLGAGSQRYFLPAPYDFDLPAEKTCHMVLSLFAAFPELTLHKKRSSDMRENNKYNLGYRYDAFFQPFLQYRYLKCIDDGIWDEISMVCNFFSNMDNCQHCAITSILLTFAIEAIASQIDAHRQKLLLQTLKQSSHTLTSFKNCNRQNRVLQVLKKLRKSELCLNFVKRFFRNVLTHI